MAVERAQITGGAAIIDKLRILRSLTTRPRGNPIANGLAAGGRLIRDEARARVSRDTGALQRNIASIRDPRPRQAGVSARVVVGVIGGAKARYGNTRRNRRLRKVGRYYVQEGQTFYWRFLELGTAKMRARPFLVPAFLVNAEKVIEVTGDAMEKAVDAALRKGGVSVL